MNVIAQFTPIEEYDLTVIYYYMNGDTEETIGSQSYKLTVSDFSSDGSSYTVIAPESATAEKIAGKPTYYPRNPTVTVTKADFTKQTVDGKTTYFVEKKVEYVAGNATYKVGHYLKNLNGEGYELIDTVSKTGVTGAVVTPEINDYSYADYEKRDVNVEITGDENQELKVYYTRRDFSLTYDTTGGKYIEGTTAPYGTVITLPATAERDGYTFAGWYKDSECTEEAGTSITLEANTNLFAKWESDNVDYTIVYQIENADDDNFSYLASVTKQAKTGESVTMTAATAGAVDTKPNDLDTQNFTFKDSTTETIKADGTTVIIVRYSRNVYTLEWNGDVYNTSGQRRDQNQGSGSVTAKYGASITTAWIAAFNTPYPNYAWSLNTRNNDKIISIDTMPGKGDKYGTGQTTLNFNGSITKLVGFRVPDIVPSAHVK